MGGDRADGLAGDGARSAAVWCGRVGKSALVSDPTRCDRSLFWPSLEIALSVFTDQKTGCTAWASRFAGNAADFIAVDYCDPTPLNDKNLFSHLTSNFSGNVDTVVVNGKVLKKDRQLTTIDKEAVFAKCREHAERLWKMI